MLVLTQLSVGAFCVGLALDALVVLPGGTSLRPVHAVAALGFGLLALGSSLLHLGRPQFAFRAILGLRHSWLSREIVAFGLFAGCASAYAAAVFLVGRADFNLEPVIEPLGWSVAATGAIAVFCSVMIYVFTQREYWSFSRVGVRFTLTCALLGIAAMWLSILAAMIAAPSLQLTELVAKASPLLCQALIVTAVVKLTWEAAIFRHLLFRRMTPLRRSAMLQAGDLSRVTLARFALGLLGGVMMPLFILRQATEAGNVTGVEFVAATSLLFIACLAGELLERYLFFTACAAPRMPGGIR
jgi:DMSO reductase anchor subunit